MPQASMRRAAVQHAGRYRMITSQAAGLNEQVVAVIENTVVFSKLLQVHICSFHVQTGPKLT